MDLEDNGFLTYLHFTFQATNMGSLRSKVPNVPSDFSCVTRRGEIAFETQYCGFLYFRAWFMSVFMNFDA